MKNIIAHKSLLDELLKDLDQPNLLWQLAILLISLTLAWFVNSRIKITHKPDNQAIKLGLGSIKRIIFPLSALLFVCIGKIVLRKWYPVSFLNIAISLLIAFALIRITVYALRYAFSSSNWLKASEKLISYSIWAGLALYVTGLLPELFETLDAANFSFGKYRVSLLLLSQAAISILLTIIVSLWLGGIIEQRLMHAEHLNINLRVVLAKFTRAVLVVIGILITLPAIGVDLTMLSVFGGALGVGMGLGLQKIASNYLSGFVILFDRSIRPGDLITVDHRYGFVSKFTARYIVLKEADGTEAIIPNDTLVTTTVLNHSYSSTQIRILIPIQISYESDLKQAMQILERIAVNTPRVLKDPSPQVSLVKFGDSSIDLELSVWIADPEQGQGNVRSGINVAIWEEFNKHGIIIPYPQREILIKQDATKSSHKFL